MESTLIIYLSIGLGIFIPLLVMIRLYLKLKAQGGRALERAKAHIGKTQIVLEDPGATINPGRPNAKGACMVLTESEIVSVSYKGAIRTIDRGDIVRVSVHDTHPRSDERNQGFRYLTVHYKVDGERDVLNIGVLDTDGWQQAIESGISREEVSE